MDHAYRCMRSLHITNKLIKKDHVNYTMLLWRELNLLVTLSSRLFEDHIVHQMKNIVGDLADKVEDHLDGKRSERIYCGLTNFQQYKIS